MAIAYRSGSTAGNASGGNLTVTKPSGVADNDILLVLLYREAGTWTLPSGWTEVADFLNNSGNATITVAWKRASSEGASYTFNLSTTTWRIAAMGAFSGCITSGSPVDVFGTRTNSLTDIEGVSITTTVADTMRVLATGNFDGATVAAGSSGMTQGAELGGTELFYVIQASAGASGLITGFTEGALSGGNWASIHLALLPAGGAQVVAVGQVTETDTAQAVGRIKLKAVAQIAETDTAQTITRVKRKAVAQVTETDTPQAITRLKAKALGQNTETDLAQSVAWSPKARLVGQISETDLAQTIARVKAKALGQVTESDLAQAIAWAPKIRQIAQVVETDLAQALTRLKAQAVALVAESDLAQAVAKLKAKLLGQVSETDLAQAISASGNQVVAVGQVTETDTAQAVGHIKLKAVAQVAEADTAQAITTRKALTIIQVSETDAGQSITKLKARLVGQTTETDAAQAVAWAPKRRLVAQVSETDLALVVVVAFMGGTTGVRGPTRVSIGESRIGATVSNGRTRVSVQASGNEAEEA